MASARTSMTARIGLALLCCAALSGCVHRRMTIRTNPPGAQVYVDGYEVGTTPCSTSFLYYGTRNIRLEKDGYETLHIRQKIPAPWYQYFPIDFFAENLTPGETRDERTLSYTMQPQLIVPTDQLLNRAEGLRHATQSTNNNGARPAIPVEIDLPGPNSSGVETLPPGGQRLPEQLPAPGADGAFTVPPGGIRN